MRCASHPAPGNPANQLESGAKADPKRFSRATFAITRTPKRRPVLAIVSIQKLRLQLGHVHIRRTLSLAPLALQTQLERLEQSPAGELLRRQRAGENHPQGVGSAARAVFFVSGDHERRAHRAGLQLATNARAVAQLDRGRETTLARKIERRRHLDRVILHAVAKIFDRARTVDHLAGIHSIGRVERRFHLLERLVQLASRTAARSNSCAPVRRRARRSSRRGTPSPARTRRAKFAGSDRYPPARANRASAGCASNPPTRDHRTRRPCRAAP